MKIERTEFYELIYDKENILDGSTTIQISILEFKIWITILKIHDIHILYRPVLLLEKIYSSSNYIFTMFNLTDKTFQGQGQVLRRIT